MMFGSSCDVHAMTRSALRDARVVEGRTAGAVALDRHDVESIRQRGQPRGVDVEHRHRVLVVKRLDDRRADLAGTDDEDPHRAGGRLAFAPGTCVECPGAWTPPPRAPARARARNARALRHGVRQRRLVDLLRARRHRRLRARADAARLRHRRAVLRRHRAHVRGGNRALSRRRAARRASRATRSTSSSRFGAAWAQMLNYVITIAISAFFVPHYLSVFWEPLRENPWDIVGGAVVIVAARRAERRRHPGVGAAEHRPRRRSTSRRSCCSCCSASCSSSARRRCRRTSTGASRRPGATSCSSIPVAMIAYTGHRDRLEPRRGGARPGADDPALDRARRRSRSSPSTSRCRSSPSRRCRWR